MTALLNIRRVIPVVTKKQTVLFLFRKHDGRNAACGIMTTPNVPQRSKPLMNGTASLEQRIRRLEDRAEIGELIARYALVMDNRDVAALPDLFTSDVVVRSAGGGMNAVGRDAVVELFLARFRILGPSNHVTHDRIITFDDGNPDRATGLVVAHAEMRVGDTPMVAAIRYVDTYRREHGRWRIAERQLHFMYYVPATGYIPAFEPRDAMRDRTGEAAAAKDWSEQLALWKGQYGDWPGERHGG
jgi:ketosteroid isomerase-like protein